MRFLRQRVAVQQSVMPLVVSILVGSSAMVVWFRKLFLVPPESHLWADGFDSNFLRWTAEWGYYALGNQHSWSLFWNAPIFYPHENTFAYSDSLLTFQLIYTPLRWFGVPTLTAVYIGLAAFAVGCFSVTVFLLRKLNIFSLVECLTIGYVAHFSLMMANFLPHYQLFGFHFAPPFFVALYLFLTRTALTWLIVAGALYVLGSCFAVYLAPSLLILGIGMTVFCLPDLLRKDDCKKILRLSAPALMVSVVLSSVLYFGHLRHYTKMVKSTSQQSIEEIVTYSAVPSSIVFGVGLGIALLIRGGGESYTEVRRLSFVAFCMMLLAIVLSWGPLVHGHKTPFYFMMEYLPVLKNTRAMGRYGMFAGLWLGVLLVMAVRLCLVGRLRQRWHSLIGSLVLMAYAVESIPTGEIFKFEEPLKERYVTLRSLIDRGDPVVELPCQNGGHVGTILRILEQMSGGLHHHGRLIVGYSGRMSPEAWQMVHLDQQLVAGKVSWLGIGADLQQRGVKAILVNLDRYPIAVSNQLTPDVLRQAGFEQVIRFADRYAIFRRVQG